MIPPFNCPYRGLTAPPCWGCPNYNPDTDECLLKCSAQTAKQYTAANGYVAQTYEQRLAAYYAERAKMMQLSKEALVDLILKKPQPF